MISGAGCNKKKKGKGQNPTAARKETRQDFSNVGFDCDSLFLTGKKNCAC